MTAVEKYIQEFAKELEVTPEELRKSTSEYFIPLDEQFGISLFPTSQGFLLISKGTPYSENKSMELFTQALYGNLFGRATRGAVIGLNEEGNLLTLSKSVEYTASYKEFREAIEDFINTAQFWRQEAINTK